MKRISVKKTLMATVIAAILAIAPVGAWAASSTSGLVAGSTTTQQTESTSQTVNAAFVTQEVNMGVAKTEGRTISDGKYIFASANDAQLLVGAASDSKKNKAAIRLGQQGAKSQVWQVKYISSSGTYMITNAYTKKVLTTNGKKVYQDKAIPLGGKNYLTQRWNITSYANGYVLTSAYKKSLSLQAAGKNKAKVTIKETSKSLNQRFWVFDATRWKASNIIKNGTYTLTSSAGKVMLEVKNGKIKAKTPFVVGKKEAKSPNQMYDITVMSKGRYKIVNVNTGLALTASGAKVVQQKYKAANKKQQWIPSVNDDGTVSFKNASTGTYLDIAKGVAAAGNAAVLTAQGEEMTDTQKWVVSPTTTGMTSVHRRGLAKANQQKSATNFTISVDLTAHELMIFQRTNKNSPWYLYKHWVVSNGIHKATLEYIGTKSQFRITNPEYKGYSAYYWSRMGGFQYFHSIIYYPGTHTVQDGRLGRSISSGCVRMSLSHAKYIYYEIPGGTRVQRYY